MSFEIHWKMFIHKRPSLEKKNSVVEIDAENLKSLMQQAYDRGFKDGERSFSGFDFLSNSIFGKK